MNGLLPSALVTCGGGFQGLAAVSLLTEVGGFRVLVGDRDETGITALLADGFRQLPPVADEAAFVAALRDVCRREDVRLVVPSTDHELESLSRARRQLEEDGARVAVCAPPLLSVLLDKGLLYRLLAAAGLPVLEPLDPRESRAPLPLIGKPTRGWGGRGLLVVRTAGDVAALRPDEVTQRVWQRYLDGAEEFSADLSIGFDGTLSAIGLRRRVRVSGGFAVVSETARSDQIEDLVANCATLLGRQGGRGVFNIQVLRQQSTLVLSDINPRIGTSCVHWRGSGFNPMLPLCCQAGLAQERPPGTSAKEPRVTVRRLEDTVLPSRPVAVVGAVVFDLDDTLVPVKHVLKARLDAALVAVADADELPRALREGHRVIEEGPRDRLIDAVSGALAWSEQKRAALLSAYLAAWPQATPTYADVKPALDGLRRRGLRIGVLTDNPPEIQRRKLETSGLLPFLDAVVFSREAGGEKPHPDGFSRVARELALPPSRLAMAGDNPYRDLVGAALSGFARLFWLRRAGAACGYDPALSCDLAGADRYETVGDLRELAARL